MRWNRNIIGAFSLCLGILIFSLQDAIIKALSGGYAVTEVVVVRAVVALPLLIAFVHFEAGLGRLFSENFRVLALRGAMLLVAYLSYYLAIAALPLADAIALFFVAPLIVTAAAGPILGERIGPRAVAAVVLGFAGVVIMLKPFGGAFEWAALLSVVSAIAYAAAMIVARKLGVSDTASVMAFHQNWVYFAGSGLIAAAFMASGAEEAPHPSLAFLMRPWTWPAPHDLALMAVCGVIAAVAMSLLTHAYRTGEARVVTVFEYTGMVWAPLWGFLFFAEWPSIATTIGGAMIFAAGMLALWPEPEAGIAQGPPHVDSVPPRVGRLLQLREARRRTV